MSPDEARAQSFKPVLSLWALVLFGLAFVGVGHLIAMLAISFTAVSYGRMAAAFPEAGSAYAYASRAIHPAAGCLAGWVMILDYLLMPMLCVIAAGILYLAVQAGGFKRKLE